MYPVNIQQTHSEFFYKVSTNTTSGYFLNETLGFFHNFVHNVSTMQLSLSLRVLLQSIHHFDHNVISRSHAVYFQKVSTKHPVATFWINPLGSFTILSTLCPPCSWATHWEFFQKVPSNVIKTYSTIYSMSSLRVYVEIEPHWESIVITLNKRPWGHCDHITGYFLKELSMSGSATWWTQCRQNCERAQGIHSKSSHWMLGRYFLKVNSMWPAGYIVIKVVDTL